MKNSLLLIVIILFCFNSFGQQTGKPISFVSIEIVDSAMKKEALYFNGMEWLAKHFTNANKVIQVSDKDAGLILAKGSFTYKAPGYMLSSEETRSISFLLKFSFKDGKYRLELSDFTDETLGIVTNGDYEDHSLSKKNIQKQWKIIQEETQSNIVSIHKSIKEFMERNADW
ncbi:MAG: DUF4468 domain-containing protein [Bacteroidota bacterium]|nr:DUF4468 domain-containing protein [Bacteroidota bacterium]